MNILGVPLTPKYYFWDSNPDSIIGSRSEVCCACQLRQSSKKCPVRDLNPCYRLERAVSYTARLTGHIHLGSRGAAPLFILLLTKTQLSAARVRSDLFKKCRISIISSLVLALPIYLSWKSRS